MSARADNAAHPDSLEDWKDDTGGPRNGTQYNRMGFDANISRHDLAETYLEQYRIAITESEPLGIMCSVSHTSCAKATAAAAAAGQGSSCLPDLSLLTLGRN